MTRRYDQSQGSQPSRQTPPQPPRKGARTQRISLDQRYQSWLEHHRQVAIDSGQRLLRHPLGSLFTMLAIAIALVLPAMLWLGTGSVRDLNTQLENSGRITLYLQAGESDDAVQQATKKVRADDDVSQVQVVTADQGLKEFQKVLGIGNVTSLLDANPLPATLLITPVNQHDPQAIQQLAQRLGEIGGVDEARVDLDWLERLHDIGLLGQRLSMGLFVLFGFGVLLVVGNTIRLAVANRRKEIEVVTMIGATHSFVRRPFLYMGAWFGLGGGVLAVLLLVVGRSWVSAPLRSLAESYGSDYSLPSLGFGGSLLMIICSILLGLIGAWVAVGRHLSDIRPD